MAHAPGPWKVSENGMDVYMQTEPETKRVTGYGISGQGFVCNLQDGEYQEYLDETERVDTAKLIAQAPRLLAALKRLKIACANQMRLEDSPDEDKAWDALFEASNALDEAAQVIQDAGG